MSPAKLLVTAVLCKFCGSTKLLLEMVSAAQTYCQWQTLCNAFTQHVNTQEIVCGNVMSTINWSNIIVLPSPIYLWSDKVEVTLIESVSPFNFACCAIRGTRWPATWLFQLDWSNGLRNRYETPPPLGPNMVRVMRRDANTYRNSVHPWLRRLRWWGNQPAPRCWQHVRY